MSPETGRVELDAWPVFRKVAIAVFFFLEIVAWQHAGMPQFRRHRLLVFLLHPGFTRRSLLIALTMGGLATLLGGLLVRLAIRPALDRWLRPVTDPSVGSFHLGAGERVAASVPARRRSGRSWRPGSLVLTDRRLWFFPEDWSMEPWFAPLGEIRRVSAEPAGIAAWLPARNWPDRVVAETADGVRELLAVYDPASIVAWFSSPARATRLPQMTLH